MNTKSRLIMRGTWDKKNHQVVLPLVFRHLVEVMMTLMTMILIGDDEVQMVEGGEISK